MEELEEMVHKFDTAELQILLAFACNNSLRFGRKRKSLLNRVLKLIKPPNFEITMLIRQLYTSKTLYRNNYSAPSRRSRRNDRFHRNAQQIYPSFSHTSMVHMSLYSDKNQFLMDSMTYNLSVQRSLRSNVKFKELPLYVQLYELLPPTRLFAIPGEKSCERNFSFHLTPHQVFDFQNIVNSKILMRIGVFDTTCEQADAIPPNTCIKINGTVIRLPCPASNRQTIPKHPLDITFAIKKTTYKRNSVCISWVSNQQYVFAINIVQKQTTSTFLKKLLSDGIRNSELTKTLIKKQLQKQNDSDISAMSLKGSLICPVGKIKMEYPCRSCTCDHLQCFDGKLYFEMNENNPKWICPICNKQASFKNLFLDGLFLDIIAKAPSDCIEVEFNKDGSWTPLKQAIEDTSYNGVTVLDESFEVAILEANKPIEVIDLE